jgi:hypothetical protein
MGVAVAASLLEVALIALHWFFAESRARCFYDSIGS